MTWPDLGINVDCLPVLDVPVRGAHDVIGDRAFAADPATVIDLGTGPDRRPDGRRRAAGDEAYSRPWPGRGRQPSGTAPGDDASARNFRPAISCTFRSLDTCPIAMTAHVVYDSIDPQRPATTSPKVIRDVIRGEIGFDGLLMSDDLSMKALDGPLGGARQGGPVRGLRRGASLQWRHGRDEATWRRKRKT